jgi:serine/threonine protein kinase
MLSDE